MTNTAPLAPMMLHYYSDLPDLTTILAYCDSTPTDDDSLPMRDRLITALDFDIADLLHNANLSDLLPIADTLPDDAYDDLMLILLDDDAFLAPLADLILDRARFA